MRGWREDDAAAYAEMTADPEVMRFMGGAIDAGESWRQLALFAGHWVLRGYGLWAVEREGALIGRVGLWQPDGWPGLEVGWLLARGAWGHGYATEAARASIEWARERARRGAADLDHRARERGIRPRRRAARHAPAARGHAAWPAGRDPRDRALIPRRPRRTSTAAG